MTDIKTQYPVVTSVVLSYNTGKYVVEALDSIKAQQYPNMEIIIADDCSKDNSVELINNWLDNNKDCNCRFIIHKENKGQCHTLNEILEIATGKYVSFIGDDLWLPEKTLEQVRILEEAGDEYGVVYGDMSYIDEAGNPKGDNTWFSDKFDAAKELPQGNIFDETIDSVTFFAQASLYNLNKLKAINFKFNKSFISEDWYLNLHITRISKAIGVRKIYCKYRFRNDSVTAINWKEDNIHNVYLSQLTMLKEMYYHPNNTKDDKRLINQKTQALAIKLYGLPAAKKTEKISIASWLLKTKLSFKNLAILIVLAVFGDLNITTRIQRG
ncbi:MAG: glycosyltransferase [Bacteroidetes bacterium]|nr:glycosyltransferase [Bacteroidota bacterium]